MHIARCNVGFQSNDSQLLAVNGVCGVCSNESYQNLWHQGMQIEKALDVKYHSPKGIMFIFILFLYAANRLILLILNQD